MEFNTLLKKLFVIAVLGGFCAPAQAMLQGTWDTTKKIVQKHPVAIALGSVGAVGLGYWKYQQWYWANEPLTVASYVRRQQYPAHTSAIDRWLRRTPFVVDLQAMSQSCAGLDIDGKDYYGNTALYYALKASADAVLFPDKELVEHLLEQGADINKVVVQGPPTLVALLYRHYWHFTGLDTLALDPSELWLFSVMLSLSDYQTFKDLALCFKGHEYNDDSLNFVDSLDYCSKKLRGKRLVCATTQEIAQALKKIPQEQREELLDETFLLMLCWDDAPTITRFMPLLAENPEWMCMFKEHLEELNCIEYKKEIGRMLGAENDKKFIQNLHTNKKLVDAHLRFR